MLQNEEYTKDKMATLTTIQILNHPRSTLPDPTYQGRYTKDTSIACSCVCDRIRLLMVDSKAGEMSSDENPVMSMPRRRLDEAETEKAAPNALVR